MSSEQVISWNPLAQTALRLGPRVLSIGVFDGLHLGHRSLLSQAAGAARQLGVGMVTVTFASDPDEVFGAGGSDKLLSDERRLELLASFTGGPVLSLPAISEVFSMEPAAFLDALSRVCAPRAFFVGADFRFGSHAHGTVTDIERWCVSRECSCNPCPLVEELGAPVTATRIRSLLSEGDVAQARTLLGGRAHSVAGTVVHGRGQGAGFGFATANLELPANGPMLPREGVYGGYGTVDGVAYPAAVNVGVARSFDAATSPLEVHLLDFEGDLYGKTVEVSFVEWLREPRVFSCQEELVATVTDNIDWVRRNLGGSGHGAH